MNADSYAVLRIGPASRGHPIVRTVVIRVAAGLLTLVGVSILVFAATQALPGNAAYAVLGHTATPTRLHALEVRLHLNQSLPNQYGDWIGGVLSSNFGTSVSGDSVSSLIGPRLVNSAVLVIGAGLVGRPIRRRGRGQTAAASPPALRSAGRPVGREASFGCARWPSRTSHRAATDSRARSRTAAPGRSSSRLAMFSRISLVVMGAIVSTLSDERNGPGAPPAAGRIPGCFKHSSIAHESCSGDTACMSVCPSAPKRAKASPS